MSRKEETKWYWPQELANRTDDGFLHVVRSTGKALGGLSSSPAKGISKIGQMLTPKEKAKEKASEQEAMKLQTQTAHPSAAQAGEETISAAPRYPRALPDLEALLEGRSPEGAAQATVLRKCLDDVVLGSEDAGEEALKILGGLGRIAEPLLVACLPTDSARVAKISLEGLSRIRSQRLLVCISSVFESSEPELRLVALHAAVGLRDSRQQRRFIERGLRDSDAQVRQRALSYVGWHDSYWAIVEAMRLCNDKEPEVQWAAVETLMALRPSEASTILPRVEPSLAAENQRRLADLLAQQKGKGVLPDTNETGTQDTSKAG